MSCADVEYLIVGAGVSGLSFANAIREEARLAGKAEPSLLILEADSEPGGYCKTIKQDGFVWDYSGHFFHFRNPEIESWLRERMPGQDVRTVEKHTSIRYDGLDIDFPFQKNIHQLGKEDFIDCLHSLYFRDQSKEVSSFKEMLYQRFGSGISERFLIPYNEKLYACDLDTLDAGAMGRFFPHADVEDIIGNMRRSDNASYNASFSYPEGGAIEFIKALLFDLPESLIAYEEALMSIDVEAKVATTTQREVRYQHLVSSAPFDKLCSMARAAHDASVFSANKVLVFNLGFDRKGADGVHWVYFPDRALPFYRIGFYDNIMGTDRMSLYVEIGARSGQEFDVEVELAGVMEGLRREGYAEDHQLVSWHSVAMDPAYVHITTASMAEHARISSDFDSNGLHAVGRYGGWTYCSIEDNIIETRALAKRLSQGTPE
ncbi:MAG: NAD(P)-binding protein [Myxococcales bacterium]|nr:NAD(P)-binding protein [Myxococcales bacterium]